MTEYLQQALTKLATEKVEAMKNAGQIERVILEPTYETLKEFCKQDNEFSQAVVECSKTFADCLKECVKGVNGAGGGISDLDVYKKAVAFYFPGASINFSMTINLCAAVEDAGSEPKQKSKVFDITDLL